MVEPQTASTTLPALERFREVNRTFPNNPQLREAKETGRQVFGWLCTYTPEELIHAAGILPVRVTGYSHEVELDDGTAYLYVNNCSFSRSCLQLGLRGEYGFLDGIVGGSTCDGMRRMFDLWRSYVRTPFYHIITVPRKYTEKAHQLYRREVERLQEHIEEWLGRKTSDEALLDSVKLYNEWRRLLRQMYELRQQEQPPISGAEVMEVLNASFRLPKETFNRWLADLLEEVQQAERPNSGRARLMVIGSVLTNPEFIRTIEHQGGLVVTDELCTSVRYWGDPVVVNEGERPLPAIARRYLNNFPCARMYPSDERFDRIIAAAREFRVDGVISQTIRYCVPYDHDLPLLQKRLKAEGLPLLTLDVEYGTAGSGQIQTRVQAFLEMLEGRRK